MPKIKFSVKLKEVSIRHGLRRDSKALGKALEKGATMSQLTFKREFSRVIHGQVRVGDTWHNFHVMLSVVDARRLVPQIESFSRRYEAAVVVGISPDQVLEDDLEEAYRELDKKVRLHFAKSARFRKPLVVIHDEPLLPSDFKIVSISELEKHHGQKLACEKEGVSIRFSRLLGFIAMRKNSY